jgi:hypothetical protein
MKRKESLSGGRSFSPAVFLSVPIGCAGTGAQVRGRGFLFNVGVFWGIMHLMLRDEILSEYKG